MWKEWQRNDKQWGSWSDCSYRSLFLVCTVCSCLSVPKLRIFTMMNFSFVLGAVTPAVVVPSLLSLSDRGYGIDKGVPTLVIAAASVDDVLAITGFGVLMGIAFSEGNVLCCHPTCRKLPQSNFKLKYHNDSKFSDNLALASSVNPDQTAPLIKVYTVCCSVCIFWMHYSVVKPLCSNFRVITTNISDVRIFRSFMVKGYHKSSNLKFIDARI